MYHKQGNKVALGITGVLAMACMALLGWQLIWVRPYEEAVIAANEAYLQSDYSGTVEAMRNVEVERMNVYQKYILAYSCVRCESFSDDSMKNILNTISLNGDEKIMEYWININRLDTEAAADIAIVKVGKGSAPWTGAESAGNIEYLPSQGAA